MGDRKATFAKRQRESDLKDRARQKEARRQERRTSGPKVNKGPEIAWDELVRYEESPTIPEVTPDPEGAPAAAAAPPAPPTPAPARPVPASPRPAPAPAPAPTPAPRPTPTKR
jgi:hypothetical protein